MGAWSPHLCSLVVLAAWERKQPRWEQDAKWLLSALDAVIEIIEDNERTLKVGSENEGLVLLPSPAAYESLLDFLGAIERSGLPDAPFDASLARIKADVRAIRDGQQTPEQYERTISFFNALAKITSPGWQPWGCTIPSGK